MIPRPVSMFFIGCASGLPFLMTLTVLDVWMKSEGISNTVIGFVTFVNIPYVLKFLWAHYIDRYKCPFIPQNISHKKGWILFSSILIAIGLFVISFLNPKDNFAMLMIVAFLVVFATSIQNIALYSFQVDNIKKIEYGPIASCVIFGYRFGMVIASSGSLFISSYFGWQAAYTFIACLVLVCTVVILQLKEPSEIESEEKTTIKRIASNFIRRNPSKYNFINKIKLSFFECLVFPFKLFQKNKNWFLIILIIISFKAGDVFVHKMSKPLYIELGFSLEDIAIVVSCFGFIATVIGGFLGGIIVKNIGIKRSMLYCNILHAFANLMYVFLYIKGYNFTLFYTSVALENLSGGMMMTAFLSFIYKMSSNCYPATQYALLWGIHAFAANIFRSLSGITVDHVGWISFYIIGFFITVPSIILILRLIYNVKIQKSLQCKNIKK